MEQIVVDSYFVMGKSHLINEDYVISGIEPEPYLILSDGCSSSNFTDIGARLLVMSVKEYLEEQLSHEQVPDAKELGLYAALKSEAATKVVGTPLSSLDATLIVAFAFDDKVYVYFYGDGAVIYRDNSNIVHLKTVEYSHNAPYYLSYKLDKSRDVVYQGSSLSETKTIESDGVLVEESIFEPTVMSFNKNNLSSLIIASDGLSSFVNTISGELMEPIDVACSLSEFKSINENFIKRRMKRFLKEMDKLNVYPSDDLSLAAMVFAH